MPRAKPQQPAPPDAVQSLAGQLQWLANNAKAAAPGCIVLFRMGDFYESFHDDARIVAKTLGLVLSGSDVPMAGFPTRHLETYLGKLVAGGHRVALCEST